MATEEQRKIFEKLAVAAKKQGLLKFNQDGIMVLALPADPAPAAGAPASGQPPLTTGGQG